MDRHFLKSAKVQGLVVSWHLGIAIQNQNLILAIHHRFGGEKHVATENSVDLLFADQLRYARRGTDIGYDHRHIHDIERAKPKIVDDRQLIGHAINDDAGWQTG